MPTQLNVHFQLCSQGAASPEESIPLTMYTSLPVSGLSVLLEGRLTTGHLRQLGRGGIVCLGVLYSISIPLPPDSKPRHK
jgi:hypothetical protein